jgi:hypothetical protein
VLPESSTLHRSPGTADHRCQPRSERDGCRDCIRRARREPFAAALTDEALELRGYPPPTVTAKDHRPQPNWGRVHRELRNAPARPAVMMMGEERIRFNQKQPGAVCEIAIPRDQEPVVKF